MLSITNTKIIAVNYILSKVVAKVTIQFDRLIQGFRSTEYTRVKADPNTGLDKLDQKYD